MATVEERVEQALDAIHQEQFRLNAFTNVLAHEARQQARKLDSKKRSKPLDGVPVAVKDLFDVAGVATTGCCAALFERPAALADASVVNRLREAGAVVVAKTNQDELAASATGTRSAMGAVTNPWGQGRIPGGSSAGSAVAVAAGIVSVAIGSDTGGSIRIPASFCGVTGLKPTWGRVGLKGAMPLNPWLDCAGSLARTAAECAAVFEVIASRTIPPRRSVAGLRVGLPPTFFRLVYSQTRAAVESAAEVFQEMGAIVVEMEESTCPELDEGWAGFIHTWAEMSRALADLVDDDRVHLEVRELLATGHGLSKERFAESQARAFQISRSFDRALSEVDAMLAPATPYPAPLSDTNEVQVEGGSLDVHEGGPSRLTVPVNLAGLPAVAFPVSFSQEELPLGAQLIGPKGTDEMLLAAVAKYQERTDWHLRRPPQSR